MFLTHADDTHDSFFPKVFPINEAETETYPDLSNLVGRNSEKTWKHSMGSSFSGHFRDSQVRS